jgi:hypothetical protein
MVETVEYGGWPNCLRLANDRVELVVTRGVGPRVVWFGFLGGPNEFREFPEQQGLTGGDEWHVFGGHRLWHAPEQMPRSYLPDNLPLECEIRADGARLVQPVEGQTGIRKAMDLELREGARVTVTHSLTNRGAWPVTLAPWALTVMAPGGIAVLPQPPLGTPEQLLPDRCIALWPYTRANDPRLLWGEGSLRVRPDPGIAQPAKIGMPSSEEWCASVNGGRLFLKRVRFQPGARYPDLNSGLECYTAGDFLELETLGPLVELEPGQTTSHVEHWFLFDGAAADDEEGVNRTVLPRVRETDALV